MRAWLLVALGASACFADGETFVAVSMDAGGETSSGDDESSSSGEETDAGSETGDEVDTDDGTTGSGTDGVMTGCDASLDDGCAPGCKGGTFDDHGYAFCSVPTTWADAREVCISMGYDLAVISDAAENAYVSERLVALTGDELGSWIGASDLATEGSWVWLDSSEPFWEGGPDGQGSDFSAWAGGEPNEGFAGEDCAMVLAGFQIWNDLSCSQSRTYACEGS